MYVTEHRYPMSNIRVVFVTLNSSSSANWSVGVAVICLPEVCLDNI